MAKRKFRKTLIIVCEGEKTEPYYITEIINYARQKNGFNYDDYKILPSVDNDLPIQQKNLGRPKRSFPKKQEGVYSYIEHTEIDPQTYEEFKGFPLRLVREAVLFLDENAYTKAWVVFDKDDHPAHKKAFEYALKKDVSIAFSSRSIEEWFLCHFERSNRSFEETTCDMCVENMANGCDGSSCLIGYLRKNFIANYEKKKDDLFVTQTVPNVKRAFVNASWTRFISREQEKSNGSWACNPYTNIDKMIQDLLTTNLLNELKINGSFEWIETDEKVSNIFCLKKLDNSRYEIKNCSDRLIVLDVFYLNNELNDSVKKGPFKIPKDGCQNIDIMNDHPIFEIQHDGICYYHKIEL